jgi:hypothetical protein
MISRDFFSVANNLGDSVAFNLESDKSYADVEFTRHFRTVVLQLQMQAPPAEFKCSPYLE